MSWRHAVAGGKVRWDRDLAVGSGFAVDNRKGLEELCRDRLRVQLANLGSVWRDAGEPSKEIVERLGWPECIDGDTCGIVTHPAGNPLLGGETVDPGSKPDALYDAANLDAPAEPRHGPSPSDSTYAVSSQDSCSLRPGHAGIGVPLMPSRIVKNTRRGDVDCRQARSVNARGGRVSPSRREP